MRWDFGLNNPNYAATFSAIGICFAFVWILDKSLWKRITGGALLILGGFLLISTASRGGFLATITALFAMALVARQRNALILVCFFCLILIVSSLLAPVVHKRYSGNSVKAALDERLDVWQGACQLSWEAGFQGLGEDGFGAAYNLLHEPRNTNRSWITALGDTQTLCVNSGWWASGLWISALFWTSTLGAVAFRTHSSMCGIVLCGCSMVWLVATIFSSHFTNGLMILLCIGINLILAAQILLDLKVPKKPLAVAALTGFILGSILLPLIGCVIDARSGTEIRLVRNNGFRWWEISKKKNENGPRIIVAAPPGYPSAGSFIRKMVQSKYSISVLQHPLLPIPAGEWMANRFNEKGGVLIGFERFTPAAVLAANLSTPTPTVITLGGPFENPVIDERLSALQPLHIECLWAHWQEGPNENEAFNYFKSIAGKRSQWVLISGLAVSDWQVGERLAHEVLEEMF